MAANTIFMAKPTVFNVPKAFHSSGTVGASTSLSFPRKVSRVRFTSVSSGKEGTFSVDETIASAGDKTSEISGNAEKSALEQKEIIEEGAGKLKDSIEKNTNELNKTAKNSFEEGKENITKIADQAADKFEEDSKNAKEGAQGAWDAAAEKAEKIKDAVVGKE